MDLQSLKNILFLDLETVSNQASFDKLDDRMQALFVKKMRFVKTDQSPEELYADKAAIYAEFGKIVNSLVNDVIMPPIGLLIGGVDFKNLFLVLKEGTTAAPYATLADAQKAGAITMNIGTFITAAITFTIIAFAVFLLVKAFNKIRTPTT